jgi:hypothetical protein
MGRFFELLRRCEKLGINEICFFFFGVVENGASDRVG